MLFKVKLLFIFIRIPNTTGERQLKENIYILEHMIVHSRSAIRPYVKAILEALQPHVQSKAFSPAIRSYTLDIFGELALSCGNPNAFDINDCMTLFYTVMHEQTITVRRRAAVHAIGNIIQGTGYPFLICSHIRRLFSLLRNALQKEQSREFRVELLRTLGILGAVDPSFIEHPTNSDAMLALYYKHTSTSSQLALMSGPTIETIHSSSDSTSHIGTLSNTSLNSTVFSNKSININGHCFYRPGVEEIVHENEWAGGANGNINPNYLKNNDRNYLGYQLGITEGYATGNSPTLGPLLVFSDLELHAKKGTEHFCIASAINALVKVALDSSLFRLHQYVVRAYMVMLK